MGEFRVSLRQASIAVLVLLAAMPALANEKAEPNPALSQYSDRCLA